MAIASGLTTVTHTKESGLQFKLPKVIQTYVLSRIGWPACDIPQVKTFKCQETIRVEISGEPLCPLILLVQTSGLALVCYKMNNHHQKHPTTK